MSKALKEAGWRLILPEIRQIVKEELQSAMGEINARFEVVNTKIGELDKRLGSTREELVSKNESLRQELLSKNESLRNEMLSMKSELKADIGKVNGELLAEIGKVNGELTAKIEKVDSSVKDLDKRLDIVQRLAIIEAKLREQEKKSSI